MCEFMFGNLLIDLIENEYQNLPVSLCYSVGVLKCQYPILFGRMSLKNHYWFEMNRWLNYLV